MKITDAFFIKVAELKKIETENNPNSEESLNLSLRVYVQGGGCSGMKYGFAFDNTTAEDDIVFGDEVKVVVDPISYEILREATLDYKDGGLSGAHFVIDNPNAKTSCGCGSSFST